MRRIRSPCCERASSGQIAASEDELERVRKLQREYLEQDRRECLAKLRAWLEQGLRANSLNSFCTNKTCALWSMDGPRS